MKLFQSAGMSSRQKLRLQRMHQSLTQLHKLKNQRNLLFKKSLNKKQKRLRNKLCLTQKRLMKNQQQDWHLSLRKYQIFQLTMVHRPVSTIGHSQQKMLMFKSNCLRVPHPRWLLLIWRPNTWKYRSKDNQNQSLMVNFVKKLELMKVSGILRINRHSTWILKKLVKQSGNQWLSVTMRLTPKKLTTQRTLVSLILKPKATYAKFYTNRSAKDRAYQQLKKNSSKN